MAPGIFVRQQPWFLVIIIGTLLTYPTSLLSTADPDLHKDLHFATVSASGPFFIVYLNPTLLVLTSLLSYG